MTVTKAQTDFDVNRIPRLYGADQEQIASARKCQADVWAGRTPEKLPILLRAPLAEAQKQIPSANVGECFYDDDLALCAQMRGACAIANAKAGGIPSIRANLGAGICLSTVGLSQLVFPDKMPWLQEHMTRKQVAKLTPDAIKIQGDFERGLTQMRRFREVMGDAVNIFCMDTQGPFDLAHLLVGDDIFMMMYDDPPLLHHVMELCLEMGIRTHTWMKEVTGEPLDQVAHSNGLYAENMGIRICEDTTVLVSRKTMEEFAMPYTRRLAAHFGGGWVHYCGRNDHLTAAVCESPELRGINFGHMPGGKQAHDFEADMELIAKSGKVYFGNWPREAGESGEDFLKRMHRWSAQGALIAQCNAAIGEHGLSDIEAVKAFWYSL